MVHFTVCHWELLFELAAMNGCVGRIDGLLSLTLSSKGGEGNGAKASEDQNACEQQRGQAHAGTSLFC